MRNFALLDENNIVINISVADESWSSEGWIPYSDENPAFIGGDYSDGFFYPEKPFPSWSRNGKGNWQPPVPMPSEGIWQWDEESQTWIKLGEQ